MNCREQLEALCSVHVGMLRNDPADEEVERVARILARGENDDRDPDEIMGDGEPRWRAFVQMAVSAIAAHRTLTAP